MASPDPPAARTARVVARPLAGLTRRNVLREAAAGVTLLAIAVPLNIGYAQIAGLPPTAGLYALVVPTVVYALTVSSRQLVASPDAAAAALVASSLAGLAVAGGAEFATLAFAQAILCGLILVALGVGRLGFLANFLSRPILVGFVGGLALHILLGQTAKMLGIAAEGDGFLGELVSLLGQLGSAQPASIAVATLAGVVVLGGRRLARTVPWALAALVATSALVAAGVFDVATLGEVAAGPPVLGWPSLEWSVWIALLPSAAALAMVAASEGLLLSRSYAERRGYRTDPNRDLVALGLGNLASGASGSFAVGPSTSRTAAMDQAGSRTQFPSIVLAVGTLALLVFGTALLEQIPSPAIGTVVAIAVLPLLGVGELRELWHRERGELAVAAVCFATTLLAGPIVGIVLAFVLSLVNVVRRASHPAIDVLAGSGEPTASLLHPAPHGEVTAPGVIVVRLAGPLFFANATTFVEAVERAVAAVQVDGAVLRYVVLDMEAVTDVDVTGAEALRGLVERLAGDGVQTAYSRMLPATRDRLGRLGISTESQFATNRDAVVALSTPE